jgi:hypothetical protein
MYSTKHHFRFATTLPGCWDKKFKVQYRELLLTSFVASSYNFEPITEFSKSVNVLDAVLWITDTGDEVSPKSVTKYFATTGCVVNYFTSDQQESMTEDLLQLKLALC